MHSLTLGCASFSGLVPINAVTGEVGPSTTNVRLWQPQNPSEPAPTFRLAPSASCQECRTILRSPFLVGTGLVHTEPRRACPESSRRARPSSILKFLSSLQPAPRRTTVPSLSFSTVDISYPSSYHFSVVSADAPWVRTAFVPRPERLALSNAKGPTLMPTIPNPSANLSAPSVSASPSESQTVIYRLSTVSLSLPTPPHSLRASAPSAPQRYPFSSSCASSCRLSTVDCQLPPSSFFSQI